MADAVQLDGLGRSFGAVRAVDGLDLTIATGETVALLGFSGAGKSTTLGMLLWLARPDSGTVRLFGAGPDRAVQAGAMLQDAGFVPNATVRELVELARALYPSPLPTAQVLHTAGLTELAGRHLDELSGGEGQPARFACALARSTTAGLDRPPRGALGRDPVLPQPDRGGTGGPVTRLALAASPGTRRPRRPHWTV